MSEANQTTLATYDDGIDAYESATVQTTSGFQKEWLDFVFKDVPVQAAVLEIGAAFGRDAHYLHSLGYHPTLTDASTGFVQRLRRRGFEAEALDIVAQSPKGRYDVILACAVFLHFTDEDFLKAIKNVKRALEKNGRFAFSVKQGQGEEWSEAKMGAPRYFNYWHADDVIPILEDAGFRVVDCQRTEDGKWLHFVATHRKAGRYE